MNIRPETQADEIAINSLQYLAFKNHPHHEPDTEPTEHKIIEQLRNTGALTLSLVAAIENDIVGHIAISPVTIGGSSTMWFGLGPVGVLPPEQGKGIGSALIHEAIERMRSMGARGIVLVGDPTYYQRFGFVQAADMSYPGVPEKYVMKLTISGTPPKGIITYHQAFEA